MDTLTVLIDKVFKLQFIITKNKRQKRRIVMKRNAKQAVIFGTTVLSMIFLSVAFASKAFAMLNPAAIYCSALGYENLTGLNSKGEVALCRLPNDQIVDAHDFMKGKVALEWSYCVQGKGYEAKRVEHSEVCKDCAVCILPDGSEQEVTELMGLSVRESICDDGTCGISENFGNCPQDCPSGGRDDFCDGVQDGECDGDCVERGGIDEDCPVAYVDFKPGSCPNPLELSHAPDKGKGKSKGVLPVAILGTPELDVQGLDPGTIRILRPECPACRSVAPIRWSYEDVAAPYAEGEECGCHETGPDGYLDLTLKFDRLEVAEKLKLYDAYGQVIPITVKADPSDDQGVTVRSQDCIIIHAQK